jgi:hypothetical protein
MEETQLLDTEAQLEDLQTKPQELEAKPQEQPEPMQPVIGEEDDMATRKVKPQGIASEVNGEGPEKVDGTSTTKADLATYSVQDDNPKVAGMAKGAASHPN